MPSLSPQAAKPQLEITVTQAGTDQESVYFEVDRQQKVDGLDLWAIAKDIHAGDCCSKVQCCGNRIYVYGGNWPRVLQIIRDGVKQGTVRFQGRQDICKWADNQAARTND